MAHIGLTPQSVNALGGYRVQGRGDEAAHRLIQDAKAMQQAGAFAVVLEVVPSDLAAQVTKALHIPTIGIGAGPAPTRRCWCGRTWPASRGRQARQVRQAVRRQVATVLHDAAADLRQRGPRRDLPRRGTRVPVTS